MAQIENWNGASPPSFLCPEAAAKSSFRALPWRYSDAWLQMEEPCYCPPSPTARKRLWVRNRAELNWGIPWGSLSPLANFHPRFFFFPSIDHAVHTGFSKAHLTRLEYPEHIC